MKQHPVFCTVLVCCGVCVLVCVGVYSYVCVLCVYAGGTGMNGMRYRGSPPSLLSRFAVDCMFMYVCMCVYETSRGGMLVSCSRNESE